MASELGSAREFISPSDLTFSWDGCHRCLWIYYNHSLRVPAFMPLVSDLAAMQEKYFAGKSSADLAPVIPAGKVESLGGWVKSTNIEVNGSKTKFAIRGKYDLLMKFEDGTYGIIDCKFQAKDSDKTDLYGPQLEAYAYSLENPAVGAGQPVDSMGLLVWNPDHAEADGFKIRQKYVPVPRDTVRFNALVEDLITMLEGDIPNSGVDCPTCKFLKARNALD